MNINDYKELTTNYQECTECYEDIVQKQVASAPIKCSQLICYNVSECYNLSIRMLRADTLETLYTSGDFARYGTKVLNLNIISTLTAGTQFKLKTISPACNDRINDTILEYQPNSNTVYLGVGPINATIAYLDVVPSSVNPPILKCSKLEVELLNVLAGINYILRNSAGQQVYKSSGHIRVYEETTVDFSKLDITAGEILTFKAELAGEDSTAHIKLQYIPENTDTAYFILKGKVFNTILMYIGRDEYSPY